VSARPRTLYARLLSAYGPQGWWPLPSRAGKRGFDSRGYHQGNYRWPRTAAERFEIIMGAILTQNTAWTNVEKALDRTRAEGLALPADLVAVPAGRLSSLIRSSGYFNQKARKLREIALAFLGKSALSARGAPSRERLLGLWGIGPETADSILLYAFRKPVFVVDAYTRRFLTRVGLIEAGAGYDRVQELFHRGLPADHETYNEMHALIVEHAKRHCRAKPACSGCPVSRSCRYFRTSHLNGRRF